MIVHLGNIFKFICGVGMFLYGMDIMSVGLQKVSGDKLSNILKALTKNKLSAILIGAFVTFVIHSSSATTVMIVGFVNAGIMSLTQAVGVIMGANIGTTITAWMVSLAELGNAVKIFEPSFFAPIIFGIGALFVVFTKKEKTKIKANIFVGVGLLFIGLTYMANGVSAYAKSKLFSDAFYILGKTPVLAVLVGAVVTAILSSSTASVSILQTLALAGSVSKSAACFITAGQNIGTCVTALLSSAKSSKNGKRAALLHLMFNVLGCVIFSVLVFLVFPWVKDLLDTKINLIEISIFHTGFNICNTLILLPFSNLMVEFTKKVIPDVGDEEIDLNLPERTAEILDERILNQPAVAIATVREELLFYFAFTIKNLRRATRLITEKNLIEQIEKVKSHEEQVDKTTAIIVKYLTKINSLNISGKQKQAVEYFLAICNDIERIGDHAENISECASSLLENESKFSEQGFKEITNIINLSNEAVENALKVVETSDEHAKKRVHDCEAQVDVLEREYRNNHIKRITANLSDTKAGIAFLDIMNNLERVTDHAKNIADYTK